MHLQQQQLTQDAPENMQIKSNNIAKATFKPAKAPNTNLMINSP
jgi:hypothetical protein